MTAEELDALHQVNDALQDYANEHLDELPLYIVKLLEQLDFLLNGP